MKKPVLLIFLAAFLLRCLLLLTAHHGDLNNNISWGQIFLQQGKWFYDNPLGRVWPYSAPNQPPLTILMFGAVMWLFQTIDSGARLFNDKFSFFPSTFIWFWEARGKDVLVKLPSVFADLGIAYLIYKYFIKLNKQKTALMLSAAWL